MIASFLYDLCQQFLSPALKSVLYSGSWNLQTTSLPVGGARARDWKAGKGRRDLLAALCWIPNTLTAAVPPHSSIWIHMAAFPTFSEPTSLSLHLNPRESSPRGLHHSPEVWVPVPSSKFLSFNNSNLFLLFTQPWHLRVLFILS